MKNNARVALSTAILFCLVANAQDSAELNTVLVESDALDESVFYTIKSQSVIGEGKIDTELPTSLLTVLDEVAGVNTTGSGRPLTGNVSIRGFSNERINLFIDNIDVNQYSDGISSISRITALTADPSLVESVIVSRGGEGVDFGTGAIGGSVVVETKDAKDYLKNGKTAGATTNFSYDSANHGGRAGVTGYALMGDFSILGHVSKAFYGDVDVGDDEIDRVKNSSDSIDSRLKLGWERDGFKIGSVTSYNDASVEEMPFRNQLSWAGRGVEETEAVKRFQQGLNLNIHRGDWLNLESNASFQSVKQNKTQRGSIVSRGKTFNFNTDDDFKDNKFSFDIANTFAHKIGSNQGNLTAKVVYDHLTFDQNEYDYDESKGLDYYGQSKGDNFAVSLKEKVQFGEKINTDFGARYDNYKRHSSNYSDGYGENKDHALSFNAGISLAATDWLDVYARYNEGFRAPNLRELYKKADWRCHRPTKYCYNEPQPNLKPETSQNMEIGFGLNFDNTSFADKLRMKLSLYKNDIDNYIASAPFMYKIVDGEKVFASPEEATHRDYSTKNIGKMKTHGAEFEMFYQKDQFDFNAAYSKIRMDAIDTPIFYLGKIEHKRQPYSNAPQDTLKLTAGYSPRENLRFAATVNHWYSQRRLPELYLKYGYGENQATTLDLSMQYKPKFLGDTTITFAVDNVTDRAYGIYPDNNGQDQSGRSFKLGIESHF